MLIKILTTTVLILALLFGGFVVLAFDSNGRISRQEFAGFALPFIAFVGLFAIWRAYKSDANSPPPLL